MPLVESFSGIRGVYDNGLDEQVALRYAYCYLHFMKRKYGEDLKFVLGHDTRPSRGILKKAVLHAFDVPVIDVGIASTPMIEFCVRHYGADGGVIITASHNEPPWNGFKFLDKDGGVLAAKDMEEIIKHYQNVKDLYVEEFSKKHLLANSNVKNLVKKEVMQRFEESNKEYVNYVLSFLSNQDKSVIKKAGLKVVLDPNGGTGWIAKLVLDKLKVHMKCINMDYGEFNRIIEPNEKSLFYLSNQVKDSGYDFAAGFDCDADRVEIMTAKGLISGNHLLALIADDILPGASNKVVVVNNATSLVVRDIAMKHGAKYIETEVGETNVVAKMFEVGAPVGGEGSSAGSIVPPNRCRDGVVTLVLLLKILAQSKKSIWELISELPPYVNIKEKIEVSGKDSSALLDTLEKHYVKKKLRVERVKGGSLKVYLTLDSFVWFRASKTEAGILRVISDARTQEKAQELIDFSLTLLKK